MTDIESTLGLSVDQVCVTNLRKVFHPKSVNEFVEVTVVRVIDISESRRQPRVINNCDRRNTLTFKTITVTMVHTSVVLYRP